MGVIQYASDCVEAAGKTKELSDKCYKKKREIYNSPAVIEMVEKTFPNTIYPPQEIEISSGDIRTKSYDIKSGTYDPVGSRVYSASGTMDDCLIATVAMIFLDLYPAYYACCNQNVITLKLDEKKQKIQYLPSFDYNSVKSKDIEYLPMQLSNPELSKKARKASKASIIIGSISILVTLIYLCLPDSLIKCFLYIAAFILVVIGMAQGGIGSNMDDKLGKVGIILNAISLLLLASPFLYLLFIFIKDMFFL